MLSQSAEAWLQHSITLYGVRKPRLRNAPLWSGAVPKG